MPPQLNPGGISGGLPRFGSLLTRGDHRAFFRSGAQVSRAAPDSGPATQGDSFQQVPRGEGQERFAVRPPASGAIRGPPRTGLEWTACIWALT